jgi:hypothetical protein
MQRVRSAKYPADYSRLAIVVFILAIALFLIMPGLAWVSTDAALSPGTGDTNGQAHTSLFNTPREIRTNSLTRGQQFSLLGSTGFADVQEMIRRFA